MEIDSPQSVFDYFREGDKIYVELHVKDKDVKAARAIFDSLFRNKDLVPNIEVTKIFSANSTSTGLTKVVAKEEIEYAKQELDEALERFQERVNQAFIKDISHGTGYIADWHK